MIGAKTLHLFRGWRLALALGLALATPHAFAAETEPADAKAVVMRQIDAFEHGDDARAWSLAAPAIHDRFSSASEFADMVKERYAPVYRHRSAEFGPAAQRGDDVGMVVTLVTDDNEVWSAIFVVSKQDDGAWRTSACLLSKADQTGL